MTLIEVLMIVAVLILAAAILLPMLRPAEARVKRVNCINHLKQLGLFFNEWALDHNDQFPMQVSVADGGTKEIGATGGVLTHFLALSNHLTAKVLICPRDLSRQPAPLFPSGLTETNISYFVNLDAVCTNPFAFLSGDRNLTNGTLPSSRILELKTNSAVGWTAEIHNQQGNVGLADGSVQACSRTRLREALKESGVATNRLAIP